jgi:hypothetical protein
MSESKLQLSTIGELPLIRRLHQAVAVGLAVFMLTLVVLREPFHGYLAEIHISGPSTPGLDLDDASQWLKKAEPHLAVVALPAGEISAKCEFRATYVAPHPKPAVAHLDDLADRWLYQYLPDRLQAYRHLALSNLRNAVAKARQQEDGAHEHLEALRQKQLVEVKQKETGDRGQGTGAEEPRVSALSGDTSRAVGSVQPPTEKQRAEAKLHDLRLELAHRMASHTDEHPEIITLKSQISALEQQLSSSGNSAAASDGNSLDLAVPGGANRAVPRSQKPSAGSVIRRMSGELQLPSVEGPVFDRGTSESALELPEAPVPNQARDSDLAGDIASAISDLANASRDRQAAEQHLTERMQEISSEPTAAQWSASPAHIVTRLGGTPRALTLALASLLACIAAIAMFQLTAMELVGIKIGSTEQLAKALGVPVLASRPATAYKTSTQGWRLVTPQRLQAATYLAEGFVAIAAGACLISVMIDPSLAREVLADPFGTLSEVVGRCTS